MMESSNPYQAPLADTRPVVGVLIGDRADLRRVAIYQKGLIFSIGASVVFYIAFGVLSARGNNPAGEARLAMAAVAALGLLLSSLSGMVFVFFLSIKVNGFVWGVIMAVVSLAPCLGLLALLLVNEKGTKVLRANGIKVGFFGARLSDISAS